jgi:hypothetical protein
MTLFRPEQLELVVSTLAVLVYACLVATVVFRPRPGPNTLPPRPTIQLVPFQWISDMHRQLRTPKLSLVLGCIAGALFLAPRASPVQVQPTRMV